MPRVQGHPQFFGYLQEVLGGIQDWQNQAAEHVGINLRSLSHDQQQLYQALQALNQEAQNAGEIAEDRAAQYWEELKTLRNHMREEQNIKDFELATAMEAERKV